MPEPESIGDAIEQVATGMVRITKEVGREIEYLSVDDMIKADRHLASKRAASQPHFGMRMTKCVPPGGG
jgi:hypothetical protein